MYVFRMMLGTFTRPLISVLVVVFVIINVCIQDDAWDVYTAIDSGSCRGSGGAGNISIALVSLLFNCEKEPHQKLHVDVPQVVGV